MSIDSLILKYRPTKFSQVIGQNSVVESFQNALEDRKSHAFLFTGPSGVGKTTLAYLGAKFVGATPSDIQQGERDAASYSGKDDMRALVETLRYRPLSKVKVVILDEVHRLSEHAWDAALKMVESPPEWVYWFFTTTDLQKVPDAIQTRCTKYQLNPVPVTTLFDYLLDIAELEGFKTPRQIVDLCVKKAAGSPRCALSNLSACYAAADRAEAARLIADFEVKEGGSPFALAQAIANGWKWDRIQPIIKAMADDGTGAETVRQTVRGYFTTVILGTTDVKLVCQALAVLDHFSEPCYTADGLTPIITAIGRILFSAV